MKQSPKQFFNNLKTKTTNFFLKLKKWFVCACKFFDDTAHNRADSVFNLIAVYILVAINIVYPALSVESNFDALWLQVVSEIVYALFVLFFIACTILYHKKSVWCWISNCLFIAHYVTLIDSEAAWNHQFTLFYLGLIFVFFCSWASWASAKDINKKGGFVDTVLLAIGLTLSILGIILKNGNYEHYKYFVVSGIGIVYLYAIARVLFWLFTSKEETKFNLIKVIIHVAFYIALIVGLPFLLTYAGVEDEIVSGTIIPIYAAAIGGILTLAGVAWTIKHNEKQRMDEEKFNCKPYLVLDEAPLSNINESTTLYVRNERINSLKTVFTQTEIFVANNADCLFAGIIVGEKYFAPFYEKLMKRNSWYLIRELQLSQSIKTDKFYLIVKDLLGNYYKFAFLVKEDIESDKNLYYNYVCYDISAPIELTNQDYNMINDSKENFN